MQHDLKKYVIDRGFKRMNGNVSLDDSVTNNLISDTKSKIDKLLFDYRGLLNAAALEGDAAIPRFHYLPTSELANIVFQEMKVFEKLREFYGKTRNVAFIRAQTRLMKTSMKGHISRVRGK